MRVADYNTIEYGAALELQRSYFDALQRGDESAQEVVMLCEHPHVYTLGKSGDANNLLVNDEFLRKIGASYFKTDRGGDITYHGYGQLVAYPILNLAKRDISLKQYIYILEEAIIQTVSHFGIVADRMDGATGVWIEQNRKIAAIGVRASRYITMHGIALNVNSDLKYFSYINPCGFTDKGVTSMSGELGRNVDFEQVKSIFVEKILTGLGVR